MQTGPSRKTRLNAPAPNPKFGAIERTKRGTGKMRIIKRSPDGKYAAVLNIEESVSLGVSATIALHSATDNPDPDVACRTQNEFGCTYLNGQPAEMETGFGDIDFERELLALIDKKLGAVLAYATEYKRGIRTK